MEKITPEMIELIKKPLPAEAITQHPTKTYLSSIKAIYVTERLNEVFGIWAWTIKTDEVTNAWKGMIVVKVIFEVPRYGIYYESFGWNDNGWESNKNFDLWDAYKWATTDAITKIASYIGIGIDVFKWKGKWGVTNKYEKEAEKRWNTKQDDLLEAIKNADSMERLQILEPHIETTCISDKQKAFFKMQFQIKYKELNRWE